MLFPPDWSTFVPDLIGAIVTGLVVGIVLFGVQRKAESRAEVARLRLQWDTVRPEIAAAFSSGIEYRALAAENPSHVFPALEHRLELLKDVPTGALADRLATRELVDLHSFVRIAYDLRLSGTRLSGAIQVASAAVAQTIGVSFHTGPNMTDWIAGFASAHIQHMPFESKKWKVNPETRARFEDAGSQVAALVDRQDILANYQNDLDALIRLETSLSREFRRAER